MSGYRACHLECDSLDRSYVTLFTIHHGTLTYTSTSSLGQFLFHCLWYTYFLGSRMLVGPNPLVWVQVTLHLCGTKGHRFYIFFLFSQPDEPF